MLSALLSRRTPDGGLIREIDGLRFFAILFVLLAHAGGIVSKRWYEQFGAVEPRLDVEALHAVMFQGKFGVFIFFAISGFILALPWLSAARDGRPAPAVRPFYRRRLTRLEPLYVFCLVTYFVLLTSLGRLSLIDDFDNLFFSLLYMHNAVYGVGSTIYLAAWSLEVEFQFYLLAPFLFAALTQMAIPRRRLALAAAIIFSCAVSDVTNSWFDSVLSYLHFFLIGALFADIFIENPDWLRRHQRAFEIAAIALLLLALTQLSWDHGRPWSMFGYVACIGAMIGAALSGGVATALLRVPALIIIGGMCYSLYLTHARVFTGLEQFAIDWTLLSGVYVADMIIVSSLMIAPALIVGALIFIAIEKPTMDPRWPSRLRAWASRLTRRPVR
ncbi:MAG: acyltransferase [Pseudomonadota bacterium]